MEIPREAKDLHRSLSLASAQFLDFAEANPDCQVPFDRAAAGGDAWRVTGSYPIQAWPTFLGPAALAELAEPTRRVSRLIKSVPERIFGLDARRIAEVFGARDEKLLKVILMRPNGIDEALARSDMMRTADGFRFLEVNTTSRLGGWQARLFVDAILGMPWMRRFLRETGTEVAYTNPLRSLLAYLAGRALDAGLDQDGEVNLAFLVGSAVALPGLAGLAGFFREEYARLIEETGRPQRGTLTFSFYDAVQETRDGLRLDGRRIHAVFEFEEGLIKAPLLRAFKAGLVHLYNGPAAPILNDKRNLALLSEHDESDLFDAEERRTIQTYVPWTRIVRPGTVRFQGETSPLCGLLIARRESMVLKQAVSLGGEGVRMGFETAPEVWEALVDQALQEGGWVAQERLRSLPHWYQQGDSGYGPCDVIWGLFCFGDRYSGGFTRVLPYGRRGVINSAQGAQEGLVLTVPE
ncbi:MAG TPA: hypothetical protein VMW27_05465 [Thermoanaerobaculia bacterium]|nr:hypothetical protein [Thermoanaerobaculia bacterium]